MYDPPNINVALNLLSEDGELAAGMKQEETNILFSIGSNIVNIVNTNVGSDCKKMKENKNENEKEKELENRKKLTFSVESGKKLIPFGMTSAIRDDAQTRQVSKNAFHVRSCSL